MSEHDLLTVSEVANYLRITERTVREMIDRGNIPAMKIGKAYRIKRTELEDFIARQEAKEQSS